MADRETCDPPDEAFEPHRPEYQAEHEQHVVQAIQDMAETFLDEGKNRRKSGIRYDHWFGQQPTRAEYLGAPGAVVEDQVGRVFLAGQSGI